MGASRQVGQASSLPVFENFQFWQAGSLPHMMIPNENRKSIPLPDPTSFAHAFAVSRRAAAPGRFRRSPG